MENENKINEAYDKLMEQATVVEENAGKLTDDQVDKIAKHIEEAALDDNEKQAIVNALPSNNGVEQIPVNVLSNEAREEVSSEKAVVSINPVTGVANVQTSNLPDDDDIPEANLEDYLDMTAYDADKINFDKVTISDSIKKEYHLSDDDAAGLITTLKRVQNKEEFPYYESLPEGLKNWCKIMAGAEGQGLLNKPMLNTIALNALNTLTNEIAADLFVADISDVIDTEIKKSGADLSTIYEGMITTKAERLREAADKAEADDPEAAKKLRGIADACVESYMMTGFIDAVKNHKLRIRKIDIEKPQKIVRDFNTKYENSKININNVWDLTYCIPRHLSEASTPVDPEVITIDTIHAFVVAFCRYCENMKNTNVEEHTFMYYFIKNILYLDTTAPGAEFTEFGKQLIDRIKGILETIHEVYGY